MVVELSVMEQRYLAVMEVISCAPVTEVACRYGVSRQAVDGWLSRHEREVLAGLAEPLSPPIISGPGSWTPELRADLLAI
jgi:hypothetical protein